MHFKEILVNVQLRKLIFVLVNGFVVLDLFGAIYIKIECTKKFSHVSFLCICFEVIIFFVIGAEYIFRFRFTAVSFQWFTLR